MTDLEALQAPIRIGISTRALFDLEEEHEIFKREGVEAYSKLQLERENDPLKEGTGFQVVKRLLDLNISKKNPQVEVILLSRNSPNLSLRAFKSVSDMGLNIKIGSFTSGRSVAPYVSAWGIDLFLSNDSNDVQAASHGKTAAAHLVTNQISVEADEAEEVRFAFDGDAVVFSPESDEIFKTQGLEAFFQHEQQNARNPMLAGPFFQFLKKLSLLRQANMVSAGVSKVRIGIVTARNAPTHERVIHTLRAWGTPADEAHFVGPNPKWPILSAMRAHIFFDDQVKHVQGAASVVPSGLVPGPHSPDMVVIPAG